ncbi:hypothetical protein Efla_002801 [Eimeria flavescens]
MGTMRFTAEDQRHLDAYLEYDALVGRTDGGRLLSPEEYAAVREKAAAAAANPLRCAWVCVPTGLHCRLVGPFSRCLCQHSFREHDVLQPPPNSSSSSSSSSSMDQEELLRVRCKVPRCRCPHFTFIPVQGSADLRCKCKHSFVDHNPATLRCSKCSVSRGPSSASRGPRSKQPLRGSLAASGGPPVRGPQTCEGFDPPMRCSCGKAFAFHETRFWFDKEGQPAGRAALGGPGGAAMGAPQGAPRPHAKTRMQPRQLVPMGGITSLVDLAEGIDRLSLYTDDPEGALLAAVGPNTQTATIYHQQQQQQQQRQQGESVDCLSLLYTPLSRPD